MDILYKVFLTSTMLTLIGCVSGISATATDSDVWAYISGVWTAFWAAVTLVLVLIMIWIT